MWTREVRFADMIRYAQKRTYERELTWGEARKMMGQGAVGHSVIGAVMFSDGTAVVQMRENDRDRLIRFMIVEKDK